MDSSGNSLNELDNLCEEYKNKISQFKDLTGFEDLKCFQILRANNWELEIAIDLALDGAYNDGQSLLFSESQVNEPSSQLRNRHVTNTSSNSINEESSSTSSNSDDNTNNSGDSNNLSSFSIIRSINWFFPIQFILNVRIVNRIYNFFISLIRPTLSYDYNGTVERFISEFEQKYGQSHPNFFRGTYSQVLDEGKRNIRFVLVYIHSPFCKDIDKFCNGVICTQNFTDFINSENIIFWSCSVNYPEGYKAWQSLKGNSYPFCALVGLRNNQMILMKKFEGFYNLEQFLLMLKSAINNNEYSLIAARLDRQERNMASMIRAQQDAAFEESLKADQEKERKRKEEEAKKASEEKLRKEKEDAEIRRKELTLEMKQTLVNKIPDEPNADNVESLRIMFKLPNGKRLERRFLKNNPIKHLYYYVFCNEPTLFNFKLRTNFPTRDLPGYAPSPDIDLDDTSESNEMNTILANCNLDNNVMLFVHDLDS